MKKLLILFVLTITILSACQTRIEREPRFDELYRLFQKSDLEVQGVGELNETGGEANKAIQIQINDRCVGIYFYNFNNARQKERIARIKKEGFMMIVGNKFDAVVNGQYVLIDAARHVDGEKIIDIFESF